MNGAPAAVVVVGAGWAGLACAVELCASGIKPIVLDAAPQAGGRARRTSVSLAGETCALDNGQHLLVGAYRETLATLETALDGQAPTLTASPLHLRSTDGLSLRTVRLPAPLHLAWGLLTARGLKVPERLAIVRLMVGLKLRNWRVPTGSTVAVLLAGARQPPSLIQRLWEPLCLAALNTSLEKACARTFANVLRDTLGTSASASDFLLPRQDLSTAFVDPVCRHLAAHSAELRLRVTVTGLERQDRHWLLRTSSGPVLADQVVLALPAPNTVRLLPPQAAEHALLLRQFAFEPIATAYLAWRGRIELPAWTMLTESLEHEHYGQWLFDRGEQHGLRLAAVVVSAAARMLLDREATQASDLQDTGGADASPGPGSRLDRFGRAIAAQVSEQLHVRACDEVVMIVEKRATFVCRPDRPRITPDHLVKGHPPGLPSPLAGLWLAGDHVYPDYPATLESAVRSGRQAARLVAGQRDLQAGY